MHEADFGGAIVLGGVLADDAHAVVLFARAGAGDKAGGFVDNQQIAVFVDDGEGQFGFWGRGRGGDFDSSVLATVRLMAAGESR